jgi:hypothetical protein
VLASWGNGIVEAWRDPGGVRELAGQVSAVVAHAAGHPDALFGKGLEGLLRLRLRSVHLLNYLGDSTGLAPHTSGLPVKSRRGDERTCSRVAIDRSAAELGSI